MNKTTDLERWDEMTKILYADDDDNYLDLVKLFLQYEGYEVLTAPDGLEMLDLFDQHKDADMILLDVMMPELDGRETCKIIREFSDIPILMLTALGDVQNEVLGLDTGADDYVAKPFTNEKLVARIKALLRRSSKTTTQLYSDEGFTFDEISTTVIIDDKRVQLTPKEFSLLETFLRNKNLVLSRDQLLDSVWGLGFEGEARTVDTHVKNLRNKLGYRSQAIKTLRNRGYCYRSDDYEKI